MMITSYYLGQSYHLGRNSDIDIVICRDLKIGLKDKIEFKS